MIVQGFLRGKGPSPIHATVMTAVESFPRSELQENCWNFQLYYAPKKRLLQASKCIGDHIFFLQLRKTKKNMRKRIGNRLSVPLLAVADCSTSAPTRTFRTCPQIVPRFRCPEPARCDPFDLRDFDRPGWRIKHRWEPAISDSRSFASEGPPRLNEFHDRASVNVLFQKYTETVSCSSTE